LSGLVGLAIQLNLFSHDANEVLKNHCLIRFCGSSSLTLQTEKMGQTFAATGNN
jgi:hypothetical protein